MSVVGDAAEALRAAANTVPKLRGYRGDQLGKMQLPAAVVGLPELTLASYCSEPTGARFPVSLLVPLGEGAMEKLMDFVGPLIAALEETGAVVDPDAGVNPFSLDFGDGMVAAGYEITVDYPLNS